MHRFYSPAKFMQFIIIILTIMLAGCNVEKSKTFTIGVINMVPDLDQTFEKFKEGMRELGYNEGKDINYIYKGAVRDFNKLSETAKFLLQAEVDLILSITTPATKAAKEATAGTGLPVVFAVVTDPVGAGIVNSMQNPGGNITGVAFGMAEARRLEWLVRIAPKIKRIYVPYNSNDKGPVLALKIVQKASARLGVKLLTREFHNSETLNDAVTKIPADADAIFILPDSLMSKRLPDMITEANKRKLPTSVSHITAVEKFDILTSFGFNQHLLGKQAARKADQIFKGMKPAELPVEMAEFFLAINLKVAKSIGLTIPDGILRQADAIYR